MKDEIPNHLSNFLFQQVHFATSHYGNRTVTVNELSHPSTDSDADVGGNDDTGTSGVVFVAVAAEGEQIGVGDAADGQLERPERTMACVREDSGMARTSNGRRNGDSSASFHPQF